MRHALATAVLAACAAAAAASGAVHGTPAAPQILSRTAESGPSSTESRLVWSEAPRGKCLHFAVRDARTLRKHDPGYAFCGGDSGIDAANLAWGNGAVFWSYADGGMTTVESIWAL